MGANVVRLDDYRRSVRPPPTAAVETHLAAMFVVWVPVVFMVPLWRVV